jgi:ArsR family transcriptional regulator
LDMNRLAEIHEAMADGTRVRMASLFEHLGEHCVRDLGTALDITQSRASRHVTTLKHAGLVADRREGTWVYFRIARDLPDPARSAVVALAEAALADPSARQDLERAKRLRRSPRCGQPTVAEDP